MEKFMVSYDLRGHNKNYQRLEELFSKLHNALKINNSCYLVETKKDNVGLRKYLSDVLDDDDSIFIVGVKPYAAWHNIDSLDDSVINLLKK